LYGVYGATWLMVLSLRRVLFPVANLLLFQASEAERQGLSDGVEWKAAWVMAIRITASAG
jgi:hypothetical protein